jgi:hypothetical protein
MNIQDADTGAGMSATDGGAGTCAWGDTRPQGEEGVSAPIKNGGKTLDEGRTISPGVTCLEFLKIGAFVDHHRLTMSRGKHEHSPEFPVSYVGRAIVEKGGPTHKCYPVEEKVGGSEGPTSRETAGGRAFVRIHAEGRI